MTNFCAKKLTCLLALASALAGLAQNYASAQVTLDAARPRFGSASAPYSTTTTQPPPSGMSTGAAQAGTAWGAQGMPVAPAYPTALPAAAVDPDKKFSAGDTVSFSIAEDRDLPVEKRVTDTGEIDFPYIGRVAVTGKNAAEVTAEVKRKLEDKYYYRATPILGIEAVAANRAIAKVYVTGEVRAPGPQDFYPGEQLTVSAAIVKAGQFTQFAKKVVQVSRKGPDGKPEVFNVDVGRILNRGERNLDRELQDGDYIHVPRAIIVF